MSDRYRRSTAMLERAERTVPLGSQTFSKSRTQFPVGTSPLFIERGKGSKVWDVDGNCYTDFVSSLCAITLGYCDSDVDAAVAEQLARGSIFSLPSPLEHEVAEAIVAVVPCAEKVRFGKNGSDATAGCIRLARAFTGRDHVAVCGYHGWQDWYIGSTTRNLGVPEATKALTHRFEYNDAQGLETLVKAHPDEFAAIILEPMGFVEPAQGFLEGLRIIADRYGIVLIFDETITGFRLALGGAQQRFGVTPDLAAFGKGLANGYPLSAVTGRADIMKLMEEVFFSFTFGGDTLSLAAAKAVIAKLQREPVIERIRSTGTEIMEGLRSIIADCHGTHLFSVIGDPSWSLITVTPEPEQDPFEIKSFVLQEMFKRGVLVLGTHNISYAHDEADIAQLLTAYSEILPECLSAMEDGSLREKIEAEPLKPLFKVR